MKIFDLTCSGCETSYSVAESSSESGKAEKLTCSICGELVAEWAEPKLRAIKLAVPSEAPNAAPSSRGAFPLV